MKRPKNIIENIPAEDLEIMKKAEKRLIITDVNWKKISNKWMKEKMGLEEYLRALNRCVFHATTWREIDGEYYHFRNYYCFKS